MALKVFKKKNTVSIVLCKGTIYRQKILNDKFKLNKNKIQKNYKDFFLEHDVMSPST